MDNEKKETRIEVLDTTHEDKWVLAERVNVDFSTGKKIRDFLRVTVKGNGFVLVVAKTTDGKFIFVRQWKIVGGESLEFVAGGIEVGQSVEDAVFSELQAEVGYRPGKIVPLNDFGFFTQTDRIANRCHIVFATECTPIPVNYVLRDEAQEMETVLLSETEVREAIRVGEIRDLGTIAGFFAMISQNVTTI